MPDNSVKAQPNSTLVPNPTLKTLDYNELMNLQASQQSTQFDTEYTTVDNEEREKETAKIC